MSKLDGLVSASLDGGLIFVQLYSTPHLSPSNQICGVLIFWFHVGLSTGQVRSGLGSTHIRLDQIGWTNFQPAADQEDDQFGRVGTSTSGGRVQLESRSGK